MPEGGARARTAFQAPVFRARPPWLGGDLQTIRNTLRNKVGLLRVGDAVRLSVVRDGETLTIDLAVGERSEETLSASSQVPQLEGVVLGPLTPESPLYDELKEGVLVIEVEMDTPAWNAGLREGDVIIEVNRREVKTTDDILAALESSEPPLLLNVRRGEGALFILVP